MPSFWQKSRICINFTPVIFFLHNHWLYGHIFLQLWGRACGPKRLNTVPQHRITEEMSHQAITKNKMKQTRNAKAFMQSPCPKKGWGCNWMNPTSDGITTEKKQTSKSAPSAIRSITTGMMHAQRKSSRYLTKPAIWGRRKTPRPGWGPRPKIPPGTHYQKKRPTSKPQPNTHHSN